MKSQKSLPKQIFSIKESQKVERKKLSLFKNPPNIKKNDKYNKGKDFKITKINIRRSSAEAHLTTKYS